MCGVTLLACLPFALGCGLMGDLTTMGCPEGEVCRVDPEARFYRAGAAPCVSEPNPFDLLAPGMSGSASVALGGTTWATASSRTAVTLTFSAEFETLESDALGLRARAVTEGAGRFSAYREDGTLADYLAIPVVRAARIVLTDGIACPEQARALLRGVSVRLVALPMSAGSHPLVDTSSSVRTETDDEVITPMDGDTVTLVVTARSITERSTLEVVDAADELIPLVSPAEQLRGELNVDGNALCFQARADGVALLGVPITTSRIEGPFVPSRWLEDAPDEFATGAASYPGCVWIESDRTTSEEGTLEIEMAGLTARYTLVDRY